VAASKRRDDGFGTRAAVPNGVRVFAIGDIHGRLDLLNALIAKIEAYQGAARTAACPIVVCLGDYVDRGPDSKGVINRLIEWRETGIETVFLKGNHEAMFEAALLTGEHFGRWLGNGGAMTLDSYGFGEQRWPPQNTSEFELELRLAVMREIPASHVEFLREALLSFSLGDYFFVHAGVRPDIPLEAQEEDDLLWIRGDFLNHTGSFGKVIVHGHTPVRLPGVQPNRIAIDTGAFFTGRLTALMLEGEQREFLTT
jgi:serine/threonine protein phosphatase 1